MRVLRVNYKKFSLEHLWCLVVLAGIFAFLNTHPIRPQDFWWHVAVGREIATTGQIPQVDTFSQTMRGTPYVAYQVFWLMEWVLYRLYATGGAVLVLMVHSLVITGAYTLLLWLSHRVSGSWRGAALGTLFAAVLGFNDWNVRPQAVTFLIAALFLLALDRVRAQGGTGWLLVFPAGMVVWVNSHGTFPLGLVLIGTWLADEGWRLLTLRLREGHWMQPRRLLAPALMLLGSAAACLLNPQGFGIVRYVLGMAGDPVIQTLVPEWASPSFATLNGALFLGGLLLSAALLILSPQRPRCSQFLLYLAFAGLGLRTIRGAVWFGLVVAPLLAEALPSLVAETRRVLRLPAAMSSSGSPFLNYLLAALVLLGACISLPWLKPWLPFPEGKAGLISQETPVAATEFLLAEQLPGPIFHTMDFGSYLVWAAQPAYPVLVDSRIELYPAALWFDYIEISSAGCEWEATLRRYGIRTLLLSPVSHATLVQAAAASPVWTQVYADEAAVIFVRAL